MNDIRSDIMSNIWRRHVFSCQTHVFTRRVNKPPFSVKLCMHSFIHSIAFSKWCMVFSICLVPEIFLRIFIRKSSAQILKFESSRTFLERSERMAFSDPEWVSEWVSHNCYVDDRSDRQTDEARPPHQSPDPKRIDSQIHSELRMNESKASIINHLLFVAPLASLHSAILY